MSPKPTAGGSAAIENFVLAFFTICFTASARTSWSSSETNGREALSVNMSAIAGFLKTKLRFVRPLVEPHRSCYTHLEIK
jgi:hypothetical protein